MGKIFAVTVILIAVVTALPFFLHMWEPPQDISATGTLIDRQMSQTLAETGILFLAAQFILGVFVWKFSSSRQDEPVKKFPGGATGLVSAAVILVGMEVLALGVFGTRAWASIYFTPPAANAMLIQAQAGQFAYYFRYPGADGKLGPIHPEKINEGAQNFFGLDPVHDPDSRDDIVTAELAIPVNREIQLLMHSKDVGHSFFVRELRIQQDFVPGLDLAIHFAATRPGKFEIVCTQLCGLGHYKMKAYLEVMSQEDFDAWLKRQAANQ
jgi:cytochrome c oxidase subunit 2